MKYLPFIILAVGLLLSGAIIAYYNSKSLIGNQDILQEIDRISELPVKQVIYDNLTAADFAALDEMTKDDPEAHSFIDEAVWLAEHNEPQHVGHSLYFLEEYIKTGTDEICIPHELEHIKIYLEHDAVDLAEKQTAFVQEYEDSWREKVETQHDKYPQFYPEFDKLMDSVDAVLPRLAEKKYDNETMELLSFIQKNEVC